MRYELMRPAQLREAIRANRPAVLPVGVLEHHGEHLPLGMDGLVVDRILARLEERMEIVVLPPFWYGAASHAVSGPEGGTLHVDAEALVPVARGLLSALLRTGLRTIHVLLHHQTENFAQGMPTDLAFRLAARQAVFAHLERERGEGWWGRPEGARYYEDHARGADPFSWIRVHPLLGPEETAQYPFDHAGEGETSFMLALCPEAVDLAALGPDAPWWTATAPRATAAQGERGIALALDRLTRLLTPTP